MFLKKWNRNRNNKNVGEDKNLMDTIPEGGRNAQRKASSKNHNQTRDADEEKKEDKEFQRRRIEIENFNGLRIHRFIERNGRSK
jgi:hypothetical protein